MKYKKIRLIILFLGATINVLLAQNPKIGFQVGIGSYEMAQFKDENGVVLRSLPFEAKVTDNFNPYWYYKADISFPVNKTVEMGLKFSYHSTAARISRADFSGEYSFDNKLSCLAPGILLDIKLYSKSKSRISIYSETGIEFSKINISQKLRVQNDVSERKENYKSQNVYTEIGLKYAYAFKQFNIGMSTGYLLDVYNGRLNNSTKLIEFGSGEGLRLNWSGIRAGVFISYNLMNKGK